MGWSGLSFGWRLAVLLVVLAAVCLVTLRSGHSWGDDFALYVLHARNLVEGRSYGDTGFLYNPATPMYSPRVYPPGFPLLLAPALALFGLNLTALKMVVVASFVAAVAVFAQLARRFVGPGAALAAAALFAFQPFLLRFKNLLLPDLPFTAALLAALYLLYRLDEERGWQLREVLLGVAAGLCVAAAIGLRTIGVTLFGALVLSWLVRRRLPTVPVLAGVATVVCIAAIALQVLPSGSGYAAQRMDLLGGTWPDAGAVARQSLTAAGRIAAGTDVLWVATGEQRAPNYGGVTRLFIRTLMAGSALLLLVGYGLRLRKATVLEMFPLAYLGALLLWNVTPPRYLIPVLPLGILYAVIGFEVLRNQRIRPLNAGLAVFAMAVFASYMVNVLRLDRSAYRGGVTAPPAVELYDYVKRCTPERAVLAGARPRAFALFTDRRAVRMRPRDVANGQLPRQLTERGVDFIVASAGSGIAAAVEAWPERFPLAHANTQWRVYRVATEGTPQPLPATPGCPRR